MKNILLMVLVTFLLYSSVLAQKLSTRLEELTAIDFLKALEKSDSVCIIPIGILEKHSTTMPLGTDIIGARNLALRAAALEYAVVFPDFYISQIYEAKHQPGTIAYSHETIWNVLQETCDELGRNGFRKIILVNGHGGNGHLLPYFCQVQLEKRKNYVVIYHAPAPAKKYLNEINKLRTAKLDGHAGFTEESTIWNIDSTLINNNYRGLQKGSDQNLIEPIDGAYFGIWWYGKYPNHYEGDESFPSKALGELMQKAKAERLAGTIKEIKQNKTLLKYQNKFYQESENPLKTKQ